MLILCSSVLSFTHICSYELYYFVLSAFFVHLFVYVWFNVKAVAKISCCTHEQEVDSEAWKPIACLCVCARVRERERERVTALILGLE